MIKMISLTQRYSKRVELYFVDDDPPFIFAGVVCGAIAKMRPRIRFTGFLTRAKDAPSSLPSRPTSSNGPQLAW